MSKYKQIPLLTSLTKLIEILNKLFTEVYEKNAELEKRIRQLEGV